MAFSQTTDGPQQAASVVYRLGEEYKSHGTAENGFTEKKEKKEPVQDQGAARYADTGGAVHHFFCLSSYLWPGDGLPGFQAPDGLPGIPFCRVKAVPVHFYHAQFPDGFCKYHDHFIFQDRPEYSCSPDPVPDVK